MSARNRNRLITRVGLLATVALFSVVILGGSARAASGGRWTINSLAVPTEFAPGDQQDMYSLLAQTVGDAPELTGKVTMTDDLPIGVKPTEAFGTLVLGEPILANPSVSGPCVILGQEVTCTFERSELEEKGFSIFPTVMQFMVGIAVSVAPGAHGSLTNVARIEGGGSSSAGTSQTNLVGTEPVGAGVAYSHTEIVNEDGSPAVQAGSHPYEFISSMRFTAAGVTPPVPEAGKPTPQAVPASAPKDIEVALPPGVIGNPLNGPRCPQRVFQTNQSQYSCSPSTQVGVIALRFYQTAATLAPALYPIYNIEPSAGQPAELGFSVSPVIHVPMLFSLRSNGDYGLTARLHNISGADAAETAIVSIWGDPGDTGHSPLRIGQLGGAGQGAEECAGFLRPCPRLTETPFLTLPSACSPGLGAGITADFWQLPGTVLPSGVPDLDDPNWTSIASPLLDGVSGCAALDLSTPAGSPGLDVQPRGAGAAGSPTGYDINLSVPQEEDPHNNATSTLRDVSVTMPKGTVVSASSAEGLGACSESQIELHSDEPLDPGKCPDSSKLGTAEIVTPLLEKPLQGSLFLAQQGNAGPGQGSNPFGSLLAVYLEASGSGVIVKLAGQVHLDQSNGQVTASFEDNPQLPFDEIRVHLFDGARAALTNPATCGPAAASALLTPYSSASATSVGGSQFDVTGCGTANFSPSFKAGDTASQRGGAYGPIAVTFGREDTEQIFSGVSTTLPEGLLARLAGVTLCGEGQANAGTCPPSSQIGTTTVSVGPGSSPITLPQPGQASDPVYLTGPYKGGAYGLSVVTPAVAGPFNLGTVVVRASLAVDPFTSQVIAKSDPLPTMLQGIPLDIRKVTLNIDRSDFTVNPTDCRAQSVGATLTSTGGVSSAASSPYQAVDCAALSFQPKLQLSLSGSTKHAGHPALKAVVTYPQQGTYANIARAQVNLPHSEFLDQGNLNKTCTRPVLLEGKCPKSSIYGRAKAWTPLLAEPLGGPVYLVGGFGYKLPALVAELNGQIRILLKGKVDSGPNKGIRNTFEAIPDAPVSRFVLEMKGGPKYSLLENSESLCVGPQRAIARFTAQNGKVLQVRPAIANDCSKSAGRGKNRN